MAGNLGAIKSGQAVVTFSLRDGKVRLALERMQKHIRKIGASFRAIGLSAFKAGGAITGAFALPIKAASDLEETMNKFNVVFGANAKAVKQWGDSFASEVGRSEKQIAGFLAQAQDTFVPLGFDPQEAEALSKQITKLSVDLASFNNTSDDDAFQRLISSMVGNTENLRAFGVVAQDAQVKAKALALGFDPKNLTPYQKAQAILNITMEGTTAAQGDAVRSAGSFANMLKRLRAELTNLSATIGGALIQDAAMFTSKISDALTVIREFAEKNGELIRTVFKVGVALSIGGGALLAIGGVFGLVSTAIGGFIAVGAALETALLAIISPIGLVTAAVGGAVYGFLQFTEAGVNLKEAIGRAFGEMGSVVKQTIDGIVTALKAGDVQAAGEVLFAGLKVLWLQSTQGLRESWNGMMKGIVDIWHKSWAAVAQVGTVVFGGIRRSWGGLSTFISQAMNNAIAGVQKAWNSTLAFLKKTYLRVKGLFGKDVAADIKKINDELAATNAQIDSDTRAVNRGLADENEANNQQSLTSQDAILEQIASNLAMKLKENAVGSEAAIREARRELQEAKDRLNQSTKGTSEEQISKAVAQAVQQSQGSRQALKSAAGTARGLFNIAGAASLLGGQTENYQKQIADSNETIKRDQKKVVRHLIASGVLA